MEEIDRKNHWEKIYQTKEFTEVSWYQKKPETSLNFLKELGVSLFDNIIDIGGGDSFFVDYLLSMGYQNITVLDISESAIERAKKRLGDKSSLVKWIVSDVTKFVPTEQYDFWHDRAAFHFLTSEEDIESYLTIANKAISEKGKLILGTFSETGPTKCSGIEIKQYSMDKMVERLNAFFSKIKCVTVDHKTPFDTIQNFVFCSFNKLMTS